MENKLKNGQKIVLAVEGLIGAGKTTTLRNMKNEWEKQGFKVCLMYEPVDEWIELGILQAFYSDPKRYASEFQAITFTTRLGMVRKAFLEMPDADIYIFERSPFSDRFIFAELQKIIMGKLLMRLYIKKWDVWNDVLGFPYPITDVIYLRPSLDKCMERVNHRQRDGEIQEDKENEEGEEGKKGVTVDYQTMLQDVHEWYFNFKPNEQFDTRESYDEVIRPFKKCIIVDSDMADGDFLNDSDHQNKIIKYIESQMSIKPSQLKQA